MDTGATFTKILASIAKRLGLKAVETIYVKLSDGGERPRELTEVPEGEEPLLGYTALEILRFKVEPVTRKLEKTIPIEY